MKAMVKCSYLKVVFPLSLLFALGRYSDRVRSEAERLDQLELDDLEVIFTLSF